MWGPFTVDASVFLSAVNPAEGEHEDSARFLKRVELSHVPLVLPTLVLPEVAAGYTRTLGDPAIGSMLAARIARFPDVVLDTLDESVSMEAAAIAVSGGLKGSDAVYAATARRFGTILVTLDRQQRERLPADIAARHPAEVLKG